MSKLVKEAVSKAAARKGLWVRVPPAALDSRRGMRIHHLNCGSLCPHGALLINGEGGLLAPAKVVCRCLLIEAGEQAKAGAAAAAE